MTNEGFKGIEETQIGNANKAVADRMNKYKQQQFALHHLSGFTDADFDGLGFKNSQGANVKKAYDKQSEAQDKKTSSIYINESAMFTGDPWFDIGLAMGRRKSEKMKAAKSEQ